MRNRTSRKDKSVSGSPLTYFPRVRTRPVAGRFAGALEAAPKAICCAARPYGFVVGADRRLK
jgi:hypothetical protein